MYFFQCLSICVGSEDDQRYSIVCNVKSIFCLLKFLRVYLSIYFYVCTRVISGPLNIGDHNIDTFTSAW